MKWEGLTGKIIVPDDPGYEQARQEYNQAINSYPLVIVYCLDCCDVANAILWAREQGVELRVRSGGHDYEGYSSGNCTLVIDTSLLDAITVDPQKSVVSVQAGTRLLPLYEVLYRYHYAFPGGTCPTVAISGLVLGGGIGLSTRYFGLTADSLLEATLIDFKGRELTASPHCNSELFWALKGAGGGNFGVVTEYKFQLRKVSDITLIQLRWDDNLTARDRFLAVWQAWLPELDRRLSAFGGIYPLGAWVNAFFYGTQAEAIQLLTPLLEIPGLTFTNIQYVPFIDAVRTIGAMYPPREAFQAAGRFVPRQFSQEELANLTALLSQAPSERNSSIRVYSLGGAVRDTDPDQSAFPYRQAEYILALVSSWERQDEAQAHQAWVRAGFDYIYPRTYGSYINFPYSQTPHYQQAYFGRNLGRLQRVKQRYDPCNVFRFPQSIRPPGC